MQIYLVGGCVRDELLNIKIFDRDWVVVGSTPAEMIAQGFKPVGKDFPVFLHPKTKEEYALARTERKTGRGYTQFAFHAAPDVTLEQDLQRRDLTINAIAKTAQGDIIDPYGGVRDLKDKLLRHVSDAFIEDPVRILRVARFLARFHHLGFRVAHETMALMREMVRNGEVDALVSERVWQECAKALSEPNPEQFFMCLRACDALKIIFPEIEAMYGVPNPPKYHPEIDTGVHTMMVLAQAAKLSDNPLVRFAALCHDFGKAVTDKSLWPKHHGHEEKGVALVKALCRRLRVPRNFMELAVLVTQEHGRVHKVKEMNPEKVLGLLEKADAFRRPERFEAFLLACIADSRGRPGFENNDYPQADYLRQAYHTAKQVDISELVMQGLKGLELAQEIRRLRSVAIKKAKVSM